AFSLRGFGAAAVVQGLRTAISFPLLAALFAVALLVAGRIAFRVAIRGADDPATTEATPPPSHCALLFAFGAAVFMIDWTPVLAARGMAVSSRLLYAPAIGGAIAFAAAFDPLCRPSLFARGSRSSGSRSRA